MAETGDDQTFRVNMWVPRRFWITPDIDLTGVVDATAAIQEGLNTRRGCCVYLPDGQVRLDHPLTIKYATLTGPESGLRLGHQVFIDGTSQVGARLNIRHTDEVAVTLDEEACLANVQFWYPDQVNDL